MAILLGLRQPKKEASCAHLPEGLSSSKSFIFEVLSIEAMSEVLPPFFTKEKLLSQVILGPFLVILGQRKTSFREKRTYMVKLTSLQI